VTNSNPEELQKLIDATREHFETGVIEATSELSAVESWLAVAEQRRSAPAAPPVPEPGADEPAPVAPGSDAPIR
jgi:hypothetical protein